ncbi:MAG: hypothetical protein ACKOQM_00220 [Novosphingobium sp.]
MEIANDIRIALGGRGQGVVAQVAEGVMPEWSGLYARLSAAHALRREMARESASAVLGGSFSDWQVPGCDGATGKQPVNLKDSTDRKGPWGNGTGIAGMVHAGDREQ